MTTPQSKEKLQEIIHEQLKASAEMVYKYHGNDAALQILIDNLDISDFHFEIHGGMGCCFYERSDVLWFKTTIRSTIKLAFCGLEKDTNNFKEFWNIAGTYFQKESYNISERLIRNFKEAGPYGADYTNL